MIKNLGTDFVCDLCSVKVHCEAGFYLDNWQNIEVFSKTYMGGAKSMTLQVCDKCGPTLNPEAKKSILKKFMEYLKHDQSEI